MAILYAFDDYKNKIAFSSYMPVVVPMQLPDGSVLFYDRGSSYGDYRLNASGYPERTDGAVDDGTATSTKWRYLICDQHDTNDKALDWGPNDIYEVLTGTNVGYGLTNTNAMITKYATNASFWWQLIKRKRDSTGLDWFMPSRNELELMYDNKTVITGQGGDAFKIDTSYWSSSEFNSERAWRRDLYYENDANSNKDLAYNCRLLRRI